MLKFLRLPRAGLRRCIPVYPGDPIAVHIIADSVDLRGFRLEAETVVCVPPNLEFRMFRRHLGIYMVLGRTRKSV